MPVSKSADLYTPQILGLAMELAAVPLADDHSFLSRTRSSTCGSTIRMGLDLDRSGAITRIGMAVSACAIGQASAAIFAKGVLGRTASEPAQQLTDITRWLSGAGAVPDLAFFNHLIPAKNYPARHSAIALPWRAAILALSNVGSAS